MVSTSLFQFAALVAALSTADAAPRVDPSVHRALRRQATVNIVVTLTESTETTVASIQEANFPTRGDKINALVDKLQRHADTTQVEINKLVVAESSSALFSRATRHWITNQVSFQDASFELVEKLANMPSVGAIREELVIPVPRFATTTVKDNTTVTVTAATPAVKNQWGVTKIQASSVWAAGYDGKGVLVGHIDTGVQGSHEALVGNYRGNNYGWFDPTANKTTPYDDVGHGTLTLGSLLGTHGIGVAPGATWMACRACTPQGCKETDLIACGQYMLCPTDPSGSRRDCSQAPQLVSNSWGGPGGDPFYEGVIKAWRAAGIIPVFAVGNSGLDCNTVNSPGDSANVIAVGMTDRFDTLDFQSSKGATASGLIKPEITAPGSGVKSAWIGDGDNEYSVETGSSIAAPYVSGTIAILLSARPHLTYDEVKMILTTTTDTAALGASGFTCNGTDDTTFPNNQYGYGRVNALKAYNEATSSKATALPTLPPSVCDTLAGLSCIRNKQCVWTDDGECEAKPPSSGSGTGSETPTPEPTTPMPTTPMPTTKAVPTPYPSATPKPKPTSTTKKPTPTPTTKKPTPTPTTKKPTPTPAPTTASPDACAGLNFSSCVRSKTCQWGKTSLHCEKKP